MRSNVEQQIITDVLSMYLGSEYPGLDDMAKAVADSLAEGAPVTP